MSKKKELDDSADKYSDGPFFTVARVTRVGGLVVNIEVVNQQWVTDDSHDPFFMFVPSPDKDGNSAFIGLHYDEKTSLFEIPKKEEKEKSDG